MKRTILDIAYEELTKKEKMTLKQLFDVVSKELKPRWKQEQPSLTVPELEKLKLGEMYKLLTIAGKFLRLKDGSWTLIEKYSPEEAGQLKLQVVEMEQ